MIRYLKFDSNGNCIGEAPKTTVKDGNTILGYNKPTNEAMLLADGYVKYIGNASIADVKLVNGEFIVIEQIQELPQQTVFTKLQIRRAMRKMGLEDRLDSILSGNFEFSKDWQDAQEIDLNDDVFKTALNQYGISGEFIQNVISNIEEQ